MTWNEEEITVLLDESWEDEKLSKEATRLRHALRIVKNDRKLTNLRAAYGFLTLAYGKDLEQAIIAYLLDNHF